MNTENTKSRKKAFSFLKFSLVLLLVIVLGIGCYLAVHWLSSVDGNDINALRENASDYFDLEDIRVRETTQRGNYLAMLYTDSNGQPGMCVFDRDKIFKDRWDASGGKKSFNKGEIVSWNYGSPTGDAVLIFCGTDIPAEKAMYTFKNDGITYTCPIEGGTALDIFVIPDCDDINATPELINLASSLLLTRDNY